MKPAAACAIVWALSGAGCSLLDCEEWTGSPDPAAAPAGAFLEIPADVLEDRIRGGLLGQLFGNLNGLPHEFKYIDEPGTVEGYVPGLPEGAWTDDDTDLEWVYVTEMARSGELLVPPARIADLWRAHINRRIWCSNLYVRSLLDLGIDPPLTGCTAVNPWASFNISGQFLCESFGLVAPAMPATASRVGVHYTRVGIDGEPAQTTQFFATMIAEAFAESDVDRLLDAGVAALDPASEIRGVVADVRAWHRAHPGDWRATRRAVKEKYVRHGGGMRDRNGYELNAAGTVAALLYGKGDLVETLRVAFAFGWDCDNNAATSATIVGVTKGRAWMDAQGWTVKDVYRNTSRDGMPGDETITSFGDKLVAIAVRAILRNGGRRGERGGRTVYLVRREAPEPAEALPEPADRMPELRARLEPAIARDLGSARERDRARGAYLALCLGLDGSFRTADPGAWARAVESLKRFPNVVRQVYDAPRPPGARLQDAARAAGIERPPKE